MRAFSNSKSTLDQLSCFLLFIYRWQVLYTRPLHFFYNKRIFAWYIRRGYIALPKLAAPPPPSLLLCTSGPQAFGYGVLPGGDVDEVEIPSNIDVNNLV